MEGGTPEGNRIFGASYDPPDHLWLSVFFTPSAASQAAGRAFLALQKICLDSADPSLQVLGGNSLVPRAIAHAS